MSVGKQYFSCLLLLTLLLTVSSCNVNKGQPVSGGKPYEVVVVGDQDSIVTKTLSAPIPDLVQKEASFDVIQVRKLKPNDLNRLSHAIVTVTIDPQKGKNIQLTTERDVDVQKQVIVHITAPNTTVLRLIMERNGSRLRNYLNNFEIERAQEVLAKHHNKTAEEAIQKMFGVQMLIPAEMKASKQGKNFLWFSQEDGANSINICLYRATDTDFKRQRDSVMSINIPGEHDGMYMQTASLTTVHITPGKSVTNWGTWEMKNDEMGGPFVAYHPIGTDITAEAFVFAPNKPKRNLLLKVEAALYTLKNKRDKKAKW